MPRQATQNKWYNSFARQVVVTAGLSLTLYINCYYYFWGKEVDGWAWLYQILYLFSQPVPFWATSSGFRDWVTGTAASTQSSRLLRATYTEHSSTSWGCHPSKQPCTISSWVLPSDNAGQSINSLHRWFYVLQKMLQTSKTRGVSFLCQTQACSKTSGIPQTACSPWSTHCPVSQQPVSTEQCFRGWHRSQASPCVSSSPMPASCRAQQDYPCWTSSGRKSSHIMQILAGPGQLPALGTAVISLRVRATYTQRQWSAGCHFLQTQQCPDDVCTQITVQLIVTVKSWGLYNAHDALFPNLLGSLH